MKKIAITLIAMLLVACASTPKPTPPSEVVKSPQATTRPDVVKRGAPERAALTTAETETRKLAVEMQELQKQSIYFDFDKYVVKPEYQGVIQKQATFIKAHKNDIVTVEGNADERGSNEYNLSLGDRRASVARRNLELLGVPATQIKAISFGEEKPRLSCHEERCWQENRRDDFVHKLN